MARRHGSKGEVMMDDAVVPGTPTIVASLNKWSLDQAREKAKVTAFGDLNHQYVQGLPDIKGSLGGWWDETELRIFDVAGGEAPATLKLVPSTITPTYFFTGPAFLDASIEVNSDGGVAISSEFVASGDWTREPASLAMMARREEQAEMAKRREADAAERAKRYDARGPYGQSLR
jgi:hypothetical protein